MQRAAGVRVEYSADTRHRATNMQLARDLQVGVLNAELERAWGTINEAVARDEAHKRRVRALEVLCMA